MNKRTVLQTGKSINGNPKVREVIYINNKKKRAANKMKKNIKQNFTLKGWVDDGHVYEEQ